jgi:nucleoside 2-deoxyribosyltransferase
MIVIGGTYDEIVVEPDSHDVMGSGMRAAAALTLRDERPAFHTALDADVEEEAGYVADALGVKLVEALPRDERVGFRYLTPISTPAVNGPSSRLADGAHFDVADDTVLLFGLIEAPAGGVKVDSDILVFDPQRPRDADPLQLQGLNAKRRFVVANTTEMGKLGRTPGGQALNAAPSLRDAAANLLSTREGIEGVVTKRGAAGSLVSWRADGEIRHHIVGAHPTSRVWPIGSGDTFSAGLAHALDSGADLVEAAKLGSAAAAHWCSTRNPAVTRKILDGDFSDVPRAAEEGSGKVYLAGPFFTVAERWLIETVKDYLEGLGVQVWSPVHEVGHGGDDVAQKDLDGLRECDAVLALLDHSDPGTIFEVGWAVRSDYPIVGFASSLNPDGAKMMAGTTVELHKDLSTACYRAAWAAMGLRPRAGWVTT